MNLQQQINYMHAAANPFPLKASFHELAGGGYKCKMCGAQFGDQGKATTHLLDKHREMESCSGKMAAGEIDSCNQKMEARDFSQSRRKKLAKSGKAMPGGGFPIVNKGDLANAKRAIGRAKNPAAARAHINERAKALGAKPIGEEMEGQTEFEPDNRLRMPKKAGTGQVTENPQYTGNQPTFQAFGFKKHGMAKHSSFGFHRGASYESKARKMGHQLPLSASREPLIQQRPARARRKITNGFRGYQVA